MAPGFSAGTIQALNGSITLADTTRYMVEVGGTTVGAHDRFIGNSVWNLDGAVEATNIGGFTPALGDRVVIIQGSHINGEFDHTVNQGPGAVGWKLVYFPTTVELQAICRADLTGSSDPNDAAYGVPDGVRDASDFFYYLDLFVFLDAAADLTGSSDPNDPTYGIPEGAIDASDFFFFLDIFAAPCA